jgi:hypothetical protein
MRGKSKCFDVAFVGYTGTGLGLRGFLKSGVGIAWNENNVTTANDRDLKKTRENKNKL